MRRVRRIVGASAVTVAVAAAALGSIPGGSVAGAAAPSSSASLVSSPSPGHASAIQTPAALATAPPQAPFITEAVPEGLSALVNWNPNAVSDAVTSYTLSASVAAGF